MDRLTATSEVFQSFAAAAYDDHATIKRKVSSKVGLDTSYTHQVIASNVPVRIRPSSASEKEVVGAEQGSTHFTVRMSAKDVHGLAELDSTCILEIAAVSGRVEAHSLNVIAPLPSASGVLDAVTVRQS